MVFNAMRGSVLWRMILVPAMISLAVTLLRLVGELASWSERWFSKETAGTVPSGLSWVVGITWLAIPFGAYFGLRLHAMGRSPRSLIKAGALSLLGILVAYGFRFLVPDIGFPQVLIIIWLYMTLAAAVQYLGWPDLFRVLLLYGYAARIPVVIVMFLAMLNDWGTHYDYVGMPPRFSMDFVPRFLWLAFFPQLTFWVGYTIVVGTFAGVVAAAISRRRPAGSS